MAVIMFPHPKQSYRKVHRLVILPDYQGIGLGKIFLEAIGGRITDYPFAITTSQPSLINCLKKDPKWVCTHQGRHGRMGENGKHGMNKTVSLKRIVTTFVYRR